MRLFNKQGRDAVLAVLFFVLSTGITWYFINDNPERYDGAGRRYLSCAIAGAKWAVQLAAAFLLLPAAQKWTYVRRLGIVCLIGSLLLLPYCFWPVRMLLASGGFYGSLIVSVLVMIPLYYRAVRKTGLPMTWFRGWLACLALAIMLQLLFAFYDTSVI